MMFWKKKKAQPKPICDHEWVNLDEGMSSAMVEIYCPKCTQSRNVTNSEARKQVKKSKLRKEYLDKMKEERLLS